MKQSYKTILLWVFLIVVFVAIYQSLKSTAGAKKISFSEFITLALPEDGTPSKVENVTVTGLEVEGELKENKSRFKTVGALDDYHKELISRGVKVEYTLDDQNTFWVSIIGTWLPMIFLFLIFFFFMRQLQSGGGKAMSFGKSKHKILTDSAKKVTFKDIAGIDEAKDELQEIIEFLKDPNGLPDLGDVSRKAYC